MSTSLTRRRFFNGTLLIAGTCIGAGMLGLPVVTGPSGFLPTLFINLLCWTVMLLTGLLFLEATFWFGDGANMVSIANGLLGRAGKWIGALSFLFLYYCLMVAYVAGGAPLLHLILSPFIENPLVSYPLFAIIFGLIVWRGTHFVSRVNSLLVGALILFYVLLLTSGLIEIDLSRFKNSNWTLSLLAAPTLFSAYGFHNVVPTLGSYFHYNKSALRKSLVLGTSLSFTIFTLWQWMIIGAMDPDNILAAGRMGVPITQVLQEVAKNPWVSFFGVGFAFFAIVTSTIGVAISMVDFLADWFQPNLQSLSHLKNAQEIIPASKETKRGILCLLVFAPPTLIALYNPGVFMGALGVAGGIGEAILNALIPIAMVYVGIYRLKLSSDSIFYTKKSWLALLLLITLVIMGIEIHHLLS